MLEAAYNDAAGVTAEFNRNMLHVFNRELGADFDPDEFEHRAYYNRLAHRIEMHLVARRALEVDIPRCGRVTFRAGESIRTEISCKYDRPSVEHLFAAAGLVVEEWVANECARLRARNRSGRHEMTARIPAGAPGRAIMAADLARRAFAPSRAAVRRIGAETGVAPDRHRHAMHRVARARSARCVAYAAAFRHDAMLGGVADRKRHAVFSRPSRRPFDVRARRSNRIRRAASA